MAERENRRDDRGQRGGDRRDNRPEETPEFADRLVAINRVSKTVKGGKRFGFAALVVVGYQRCRVGFGKGKAKEVPEAIRKATEQAKRQLIRVPLKDSRTLHHDMEGRHGAGKVVMRAAVIRKVLADLPVSPNLKDLAQTRAAFSWQAIRDELSSASASDFNMARLAVDRHATGDRANQTARLGVELLCSLLGKKIL